MTADGPWAAFAETHSSIVVFAGDRAYKLKKPVTFDFLDFSTRELRERAAHREVELNRRIAPDVYLGVSDVLDVDGTLCDHLVVMRRMPADRRLSTLATTGRVTDADLRAIARTIAVFHAGAVRNGATAEAGSPASVTAKLELDLADLRRFAGSVFAPDALAEAAARARRYLEGRARLLEARVAGGWVCDGHGDVLADDIFCLADGPRILDCIDFSDELRYGDVLADVAFLAMDLARLGVPDLGERFLRHYDEFSGEHHPSSLADYYVAFRALIRAKVSALRTEQGDDAARGAAVALLELALARLRRGRVAMVVVGGAPGTGKTTVAEALGEQQHWAVLRSDVVRKELAGLGPHERRPAGIGEDLYSPERTRRTYGELLGRARVALELGQSVVLDASWSDAAFRRDADAVATAAAADLVELRCVVEPAVADARVEQRRARGHDASDADAAVAAALRAAADPWPEATVVDTSGSRAAALDQALAACAARPWPDEEAVRPTGSPPRA